MPRSAAILLFYALVMTTAAYPQTIPASTLQKAQKHKEAALRYYHDEQFSPQALKEFEIAAKMFAEIGGKEHREAAFCRYMAGLCHYEIGLILKKQHQDDEGFAHLQKSFQILQRLYEGEDHEDHDSISIPPMLLSQSQLVRNWYIHPVQEVNEGSKWLNVRWADQANGFVEPTAKTLSSGSFLVQPKRRMYLHVFYKTVRCRVLRGASYPLQEEQLQGYALSQVIGQHKITNLYLIVSEQKDIAEKSVFSLLEFPWRALPTEKTTMPYPAMLFSIEEMDFYIYRTKPGDTLYSIIDKFFDTNGKSTLRSEICLQIFAANRAQDVDDATHLQSPNHLPVDYALKIPASLKK